MMVHLIAGSDAYTMLRLVSLAICNIVFLTIVIFFARGIMVYLIRTMRHSRKRIAHKHFWKGYRMGLIDAESAAAEVDSLADTSQ